LPDWGLRHRSFGLLAAGVWFGAVAILFVFCVYWGYFAIFEIFWKGQTPGKRLAKIRVIKESGRPSMLMRLLRATIVRSTYFDDVWRWHRSHDAHFKPPVGDFVRERWSFTTNVRKKSGRMTDWRWQLPRPILNSPCSVR